ncbi:MAG: glycosyltransferase family 39 protein [Runella slithyformis]|nr:MAG: glycosyltransferase family 39 protein [Runella slithyformis]TAF26432.1 MAG: glycosyltransferase family 39 protein [Runella slithyformis]TAF44720.1 MAG: glycosyltransferase family 39 protein [Runella slithyformis]TAF80531.1 MAG: glycosyltransferase family 39 protein [Runella slithyformis]
MIKKLESPWTVALLALLFFVPFLGNVHLFDWDEINFAESAREMLLTQNYWRVQIDFKPFWEKPPLFFWLQVLSMKIFGVNEFAARFPNAVMGVVTLLTLFFVGKSLINKRFGFLWALAYLGSFTPHLYFKSGIIDPTFNYFMFLSVVCLTPVSVRIANPKLSGSALQMPTSNVARFFWAGLFAGLAVWTKGPVGVGIPTLTLGLVWAFNRSRPVVSFKQLLVYGGTAALVGASWVALLVVESGWDTFLAFLEYLYRLGATSEADHGEPFYYHFVVVLLGCFPISVLGMKYVFQISNIRYQISAVKYQISDNKYQTFSIFMLALFWVVMIVFSIVKTKIVHYSSMAYFPLSYLAALHLYNWLNGDVKWPRWATVLTGVIGFLMAAVLVAVPLVGMYAPQIVPRIDDAFAVANLRAPVEWGGWEWGIGAIYFAVVLYCLFIWQKCGWFAVKCLFLSTAICLMVYTAIVVPKIEGYSQRTVIDFYESKRGQDVYVSPVGFHSYAHLYYFQKPMGSRPEASDENWLLNGPVDKPTFVIARIDRADDYYRNRNLELIKEENGFVFFKRKTN